MSIAEFDEREFSVMEYEQKTGAPVTGLLRSAPIPAGPLDGARRKEALQHLISERRRRSEHFSGSLFSDPAWDILLVLALAEARHQRLSVTKLCERIDAPTTTALRWISALTDFGLLIRRDDVNDKRRKFIQLSPGAVAAMTAYCTAGRAPLALAA